MFKFIVTLFLDYVSTCNQGRNEGSKGVQFPGRRITAWNSGKSQKCHKYFLQYSAFTSEEPQVRTWGRQTCFLPQAPSNLITPLPTIDCFDVSHWFPRFCSSMRSFPTRSGSQRGPYRPPGAVGNSRGAVKQKWAIGGR